ncbi:MAG: gliding motility-associated ABC transporter substrate-binding protein GldG [Ferruginibacter sp.]
MKSITNKIINSKAGIPVFILLLVAINWLASLFHGRIDLTNEKRFTLSNSTKDLLKNLDSTVDITVLLTGDIKSEFKKLSTSTKELLDNFKDYSGNRIQYKFELPGEGLDDSVKAQIYDSLIAMGLRPTNQQVQVKEGEGKNLREIFPGAVIKYGDRTIAIDFLEGQVQKNVFNSDNILDKESLNSAEALLEYKFANAIQKLTEKEIPIVAYAYGNGEPQFGVPFVYDVFETLGRNFIVDTINIRTQPFIPQQYGAVVIVKPIEQFTDDDKFKLDQYVMNGGKLLFFLDVLYSESDSLQNNTLTAYSRDLNINDLLFQYGVRINNDLIADKHCDKLPVEVGSVGGQSQKQLLPFPYYPLLQPASNNPIVKNEADVLAQFASSIDTVEADNITKTILLSSSENAYTISTPAQIDINSMQVEEDISKYNKKDIPVAILLEGNFSSMFAYRATQAQLDTLKSYNIPFLKKGIAPGKMIVVSNGGIVTNSVSDVVGPLPMGTNKYTKIQYANHDFFLNCVDYLANTNTMLEAKSKDYTLRLLDPKKIDEQRTQWQVIDIAGPILLVFLFALLYQWWRKKRYVA